MILLYFFIAILAGVSIVVARIINANLAEAIGLSQSTFYNYLTGFLFSLVVLLASHERVNFLSIDWQRVPYWAYLGGVVSILVVVLSSYITPKISVFYQTLFVFIGQLFIGLLADFFLSNQLSLGKLLGGLLVLGGLSFNLVVDQKSSIK